MLCNFAIVGEQSLCLALLSCKSKKNQTDHWKANIICVLLIFLTIIALSTFVFSILVKIKSKPKTNIHRITKDF